MMSQSQIDLTITYGVLAFLACGNSWVCGLPLSTLTLGSLGAMSGSFGEWRTDRGLWMLGALYLLIFGGLSLLLTYFQIADALAGRAQFFEIVAVDCTVNTIALSYMVRFLLGVTYWNAKLSSDA